MYKVNTLRNTYVLTPRRIIEVLIVSTICILFVIANFGLHVSKNQLTLILLTFSTAAYRLLPSLNEIITNIVKVKTSGYVLDLLNFIKEPANSSDLKPVSFKSKIELVNVSFKYKENSAIILNELNLLINKGDFIVLTGDWSSLCWQSAWKAIQTLHSAKFIWTNHESIGHSFK